MSAVQIFLSLTIGLIMLAMGLGLALDDFARVLREPRAALVGVLGQILMLPALAFGLAYAFGLR